MKNPEDLTPQAKLHETPKCLKPKSINQLTKLNRFLKFKMKKVLKFQSKTAESSNLSKDNTKTHSKCTTAHKHKLSQRSIGPTSTQRNSINQFILHKPKRIKDRLFNLVRCL